MDIDAPMNAAQAELDSPWLRDQSPRPRREMSEIERAALECECNGWLPKGIADYPRP